MAEKGNSEEAAFSVLGRVEVDLDTLKKSLGDAESEVRDSGERLKRTWAASAPSGAILAGAGAVAGPGAAPPGVGPGGPGGPAEPPEGGAPVVLAGGGGQPVLTTAADFVFLAKILRHTLTPALMQLNPAMGQFVRIGTIAGHTAAAAGIALGGFAAGAAILSAVIGKYVAAAKDATAATLDIRQALATLDASRVEAGMAKITDSLAAYNLAAEQVAGKTDAGFWQKVFAWTSVMTEKMTGTIDAQIKKLSEYADALHQLETKVGIPKALVEADKAAADIAGREAQSFIRRAADEAALAAGFDKTRASIEKKGAAQLRSIQIDEDAAVARQKNMKLQGQQRILDDAKAVRDAAMRVAVEDVRKMQPGFEGSETEAVRLRDINADYMEAQARAATLGAKFDKNIVDIKVKSDLERKSSSASTARSIIEDQEKEQESASQRAAAAEDFVQKEIDRNQKRYESGMATAKAITDAEKVVGDLRRKQFGEVESAAELEARFTVDRVHASEMSAAAIEAVTKKYESQARALKALIDGHIDVLANVQKLADVEKSSVAEVAALRDKHQQEESARGAELAQERQARVQEEVALEDKRFAHFTAMGRITMQEEMARQGRATTDPRRTVDQQEAAERELLGMRKQYADEYFRYYQSLGTSTWADQLTSARQFLAEAITGSKEWFAAVDKVAGLYRGIYEQAKGIFSQQVGIAEAEARKEGRETMSIGDVSGYMARVRERDARALSGARVPLGEIPAAIGRKDFWKTVDREGLTPGAAFQKMQEGPQDKLAQALAETATRTAGFSATLETATVTSKQLGDALGGMIPSLLDAAVKSRDLADAAKQAADNLRKIPPPPPLLTKENNAPSSGNVLGSSRDGVYTHPGQPISGALDNALGRNLQLANRRGVNTNESAL